MNAVEKYPSMNDVDYPTPLASDHTEGTEECLTPSEIAGKALRERPRISLRMQIYSSFLFSFILIIGIAVALLVTSHMMESKIHFLGIANSYLFEIQQARRYEKNFFLYGTNLTDALQSVYQARDILQENAEQLETVAGSETFDAIFPQLDRYQQLLENLETMPGNSISPDYQSTKREAQLELRRCGQQVAFSARELMQEEKTALDRTIVLSRNVHFSSLAVLFLVIGFNTYLLRRRLLARINRFVTYAQRIAGGDYTPIMPARRYQDEFSDLAIAINQMIDELEHRQDILVQSHKLRAVGTLTAGVAHELNNPINNLMLTGHMLLEDYTNLSDEERLDMIKDIVSETTRSKGIICNLLDFARESESAMESLDLGDVIHETLELAANQITLAGVHINLKVTPNLPRIYGDKQQLRQVFLNLVLNALDVTAKRGTIEVGVIPIGDPGFLAVTVADFGAGIPEHILPSIFDPFFTTKSKRGGTGLGLSVSHGIIAKHGGEITVKSKVNAGTTFRVTLPVTSFAVNP